MEPHPSPTPLAHRRATKKRIAIIGAGESGLLLGLGLRNAGYDVTIVSNRSPEQIHLGKVTSSQVMFETALQAERDLGLNFWKRSVRRSTGSD